MSVHTETRNKKNTSSENLLILLKLHYFHKNLIYYFTKIMFSNFKKFEMRHKTFLKLKMY